MKLLTALLLSTFVISAQAQDKPLVTKQVKDDIGISFNITGLINSVQLNAVKDINGDEALMLRYFFKDDMAVRGGFGITYTSLHFSSVDSMGAAQVSWDSTFRQTNFYISPGIEKHFYTKGRLDPYMAAELQIGSLGKQSMKSDQSTTDTLGTSTRSITGSMAGGYSFGVNLVAGFNFFFNDKIAIGAEYSYGFAATSSGGDWTNVIIDTPAATQKPTTTRQEGSSIVGSTSLKASSGAGITLSYYFSKGKKDKSKRKRSESSES